MRERGQTIAEAAMVMPWLVILVLGTIQLGMAAYGAVVARFTLFAALRAGVVAVPGGTAVACMHAAQSVVGAAPGVRLDEVKLQAPVFPLPGSGASRRRLFCVIRVSVPRIVPFMRAVRLTSQGSMPMEPAP